jgi:hypothetical protein
MNFLIASVGISVSSGFQLPICAKSCPFRGAVILELLKARESALLRTNFTHIQRNLAIIVGIDEFGYELLVFLIHLMMRV